MDPELSRALFIEHALVDGELVTSGPFAAHNRDLLEALETVEARLRRRDLVAERAVRFAFFDRLVPAGVYSGRRFESWRRSAERDDPELLHLRREDLLLAPVPADLGERFPDVIRVGATTFPLEYRLEPGDPEDGITMIVPLDAVNQLDAWRLEWLVPGRLEEKIVALLRSLPKSLRRHFVPAPDFARAAASRLQFGEGSLLESLGATLEAMSGIEVPCTAWCPAELPEPMRMNVRVVDEHGQAIAHGRDLARLRESLGMQARRALAESGAAEFNQRGLTDWTIGDLPERVVTMRGGATLPGYPALVDEGSSVALQLIDEPCRAERLHREGTRRLLLLQVEGEVAFQIPALPGIESMRMRFALLEETATLDDQLALLLADRAFIGDDPPPRTAGEFRRRLDEGYGRIWEVGLQVAPVVGEILAAVAALHEALERPIPSAWGASVEDLRLYADRLMPPRVLIETPWDRLQHLPRLLQAALLRFRKLAHGGHQRDQRLMEDLRPLMDAFEQRTESLARHGIIDPALERYRWMLEEYRVSLFAQELRTATPVSRRRLDALWREVRPAR